MRTSAIRSTLRFHWLIAKSCTNTRVARLYWSESVLASLTFLGVRSFHESSEERLQQGHLVGGQAHRFVEADFGDLAIDALASRMALEFSKEMLEVGGIRLDELRLSARACAS